MNEVRIDTTVSEALVQALPALRPLLGHRAMVIALDQGLEPTAPPLARRRHPPAEIAGKGRVLGDLVAPLVDEVDWEEPR